MLSSFLFCGRCQVLAVNASHRAKTSKLKSDVLETPIILMPDYCKGWKKHINFFNINFLAPTQTPILSPKKKGPT